MLGIQHWSASNPRHPPPACTGILSVLPAIRIHALFKLSSKPPPILLFSFAPSLLFYYLSTDKSLSCCSEVCAHMGAGRSRKLRKREIKTLAMRRECM